MNYRTIWAYLKFSTDKESFVQVPLIIIEAYLGKGRGSKLFTELEGNLIEILLAGEQGFLNINSFKDIEKLLDQDESNILKLCLDNIQRKGFVKFKKDFFI